MRLLDLTLPTPAENLALDEALLLDAEQSVQPEELLRIWESAEPMVVLGRSSQAELEVDLAECRRLQVPVLRRTSGGAAIAAGPGCLMYAVVLSFELRPELRSVDAAHGFVLETILAGLRPLAAGARRQGTSDLVIAGRKFSGNSLRLKRRHLLYHGTLLYDLPAALIARLLRQPPRQPEYRQDRSHGDFITNLAVGRDRLKQALLGAWQPDRETLEWPQALVAQLVAEKYSQPS